MQNTNSLLKLSVITPDDGPVNAECDSVHVTVRDDAKGHGGGEYGIRPGHTKALLSLDKGMLRAFRGEEMILSLICDAGFARIENNSVTVVVGHTEKRKN